MTVNEPLPLSAPRHLPHLTHPEVVTVGMRPMGSEWLEPAEDPAAMRVHKLERRETLGEAVYAYVPAGVEAACELAQRIALHCGRDADYLQQFPRQEWLWQASLDTHEDLVVMAPEAQSYAMVAASLCSPSHWRLPEKIGRPMARIHDPIPGIHERVTPRIDRIFHNLRTDTPVERYNWALQPSDALFCWPESHDSELPADTPLFYRVERQTLTRLPNSGALAFTIRVYIDPLESLLAVPDALAALLRAVDAAPEAVGHYKSFDWMSAALDKYRTAANCAAADRVLSE